MSPALSDECRFVSDEFRFVSDECRFVSDEFRFVSDECRFVSSDFIFYCSKLLELFKLYVDRTFK